jgi:hypothetical protein
MQYVFLSIVQLKVGLGTQFYMRFRASISKNSPIDLPYRRIRRRGQNLRAMRRSRPSCDLVRLYRSIGRQDSIHA